MLPKPYGKGHPPIWVACGNPPTFTRAGELGIGAIAFNFEPIYTLRGRIEAYKEGAANCTDPIGQFKNDNVMITNSVICNENRDEAREIAFRKGRGYLVSMVNLYHDTMPKSEDAITWPSTPLSLSEIAAGDEDALLDGLIEAGYMLVGTPDEVSEQISNWGDVGMDQLVFGLPIEGMHHEEVLGVPRALRRQGHPGVRQGPHPLDRLLPRHRAAEVRHVLGAAAGRCRMAVDHPGERPRTPPGMSGARSKTAGACHATQPRPKRGSRAKPSDSSRRAACTR